MHSDHIELDIVQPLIHFSDPLVTRYGQPGSMDISGRGASMDCVDPCECQLKSVHSQDTPSVPR
jgi:hypothetical protein